MYTLKVNISSTETHLHGFRFKSKGVLFYAKEVFTFKLF